MNVKSLVPLAALSLLVGTAVAADQPKQKSKYVDDNMIGLKTPNGKIAYEFIDLWFNQHKGEEAFDKYVSHDYMNHAVYSASVNKPKTFEEEKTEESRISANSTTKFEIKQLVAQGSLVFAHIHAVKPNSPGNELVMILRVRDGKITDHWDIHEPLKDDSAVFVGLDR